MASTINTTIGQIRGSAMSKKQLGNTEIEVSPIGLGCMSLSEFYGPPTEENQAIALIHQAIESGVDHFDTAESYGVGSANEKLLGKALAGKRENIVLATKFGPLRDPETGDSIGLDGSAKNCRRAIEASLQRLQTDYVDLFYLHRVDPKTPIEETVAAMGELLSEGKIRGIGLSEASGETIRRAAAVHPITVVQSEYSIFSRDIEDDVLPACEEVGATLVAYSPLGRGMLTGSFGANAELSDSDWRKSMQPRFEGDAYQANLNLVGEVIRIAESNNCPPAQIALAWVLQRPANLVTIPGTTKLDNLRINLGAYDLALRPEDRQALDALADKVQGTRYSQAAMTLINA